MQKATPPASLLCGLPGAHLGCVGGKGGSRAIFSLFFQRPVQNTLPNFTLQILTSWMELKSSVRFFIFIFLSFSAGVKIDQQGLC